MKKENQNAKKQFQALGGKVANNYEARPVRRILEPRSGEHVGWIYEWNTGERSILWISKADDQSTQNQQQSRS